MDLSKIISISLGTENCENLIIPKEAIKLLEVTLEKPRTLHFGDGQTLTQTLATEFKVVIDIKLLLENFNSESALYDIMLDNKPLTFELLKEFLYSRKDLAVVGILEQSKPEKDIYPIWNEIDEYTNYYQENSIDENLVEISVFKH